MKKQVLLLILLVWILTGCSEETTYSCSTDPRNSIILTDMFTAKNGKVVTELTGISIGYESDFWQGKQTALEWVDNLEKDTNEIQGVTIFYNYNDEFQIFSFGTAIDYRILDLKNRKLYREDLNLDNIIRNLEESDFTCELQ